MRRQEGGQLHPVKGGQFIRFLQLNELIEKIRNSEYIKPVLITKQYIIISGHRRVQAAIQLGYKEIDYEYVSDDPQRQLEIFLLENHYREKTQLQKTREAQFYWEIEKEKAEKRKLQAGMENLGKSPEVEIFPPLAETGKTRDLVAEKVGMSGRNLEKSMQVVERIDMTPDEDMKWFFGESLNNSVDATYVLLKKPNEIVKEVIEKTGGDVKKVPSALREVEKQQVMSSVQLPEGKYTVLMCDITQTPLNNLIPIPLGDIGDDNSVLFLWVLPTQLDKVFKVISHWGYQYQTCMVWNKDVINEVSDLAELLLISVKGSPAMVHQSDQPKNRTLKPHMVMAMIKTAYPNNRRIALRLGQSIEGFRTF